MKVKPGAENRVLQMLLFPLGALFLFILFELGPSCTPLPQTATS